MRIATYNVNGVNGRLANLLDWLSETKPDVVCLQELKAPQEKFPIGSIREAGYDAIWHGQKSWNGVAILTRDTTAVESRRVLPGDPEDLHSRYIEAAIGGMMVGCLYLPNGKPRSQARSSSTSSGGSIASRNTPRRCWRTARRRSSSVTSTSFPPSSMSTSRRSGATTRSSALRCAKRSAAS